MKSFIWEKVKICFLSQAIAHNIFLMIDFMPEILKNWNNLFFVLFTYFRDHQNSNFRLIFHFEKWNLVKIIQMKTRAISENIQVRIILKD